jgi:hypothetical protein
MTYEQSIFQKSSCIWEPGLDRFRLKISVAQKLSGAFRQHHTFILKAGFLSRKQIPSQLCKMFGTSFKGAPSVMKDDYRSIRLRVNLRD